jgi:hypothetical protein
MIKKKKKNLLGNRKQLVYPKHIKNNQMKKKCITVLIYIIEH